MDPNQNNSAKQNRAGDVNASSRERSERDKAVPRPSSAKEGGAMPQEKPSTQAPPPQTPPQPQQKKPTQTNTPPQQHAPQKPFTKRAVYTSDILRPLRTYKDDVAFALGKQKGSTIHVAAKEEERREKRRALAAHEDRLQKEIEKEGIKIRSLDAQIRASEKAGLPIPKEPAPVAPPAARAPTPPQPREVPERKVYTPPPGVLSQQNRAPKPPQLQPDDAARKAKEALRDEQAAAQKKAAQERLAEVRAKLSETRQARAVTTPTRLHPPEREARVSKRTLAIVGISVLFLAAAGGISAYVFQNLDRIGTVDPQEGAPSLVQVNTVINVPLSEGTSLPKNLEQIIVSASFVDGSVTQLVITQDFAGVQRLISAPEFVALLETAAPGRLTRSLGPVYTFGVHARGEPEVFLVLQTSFFENAFAGMLEWERTMNTDLAPLFGPPLPRSIGTTTTATRPLGFADRVVRNKDTRVLLDENSNVALVYAFVDRNTLIIAPSVETFIEVFGRMSSGRTVR